MELILLWFGLAVVVGVAASTRGRSGFAWFLLAVVISPLLAGLLVLAMPSVRMEAVAASQNATSQMMFDALPDDAKERVHVAQAKREQEAESKRLLHHMFRTIVILVVAVLAVAYCVKQEPSNAPTPADEATPALPSWCDANAQYCDGVPMKPLDTSPKP
jgi:phosphate/sulfate permease